MTLYDNSDYLDDIKLVANAKLPWHKLKNKSVMLSGATGMIGSFLVDVLLYKNQQDDLGCEIYALGRNEQKAAHRFGENMKRIHFIHYDINKPFVQNELGTIDYVLHLASNTHPVAYATDPIGTITININGVANMLEFAVCHNATRCVFASSNEIYGENRGDVEKFDEGYCGYIDCNTMRAGYPESKRCGEALCQAYIRQKNLDVVIPRFTRSYGPTMLMSDTKAISQFLKKAVAGEDIILKSAGNQYYSYTYIADVVEGLLTVMLCGEKGEAYNIADEASDITLKDLASLMAATNGREVRFELPDDIESAGYSKATKARLDSAKLQQLGWKAHYDIKTGIERTINILKTIS